MKLFDDDRRLIEVARRAIDCRHVTQQLSPGMHLPGIAIEREYTLMSAPTCHGANAEPQSEKLRQTGRQVKHRPPTLI
jgi:hypothetical protein